VALATQDVATDELLSRLVGELSHFVRCDVELTVVGRSPALRRGAVDASVVLVAAATLALALAAFSWAAILALDNVVASWLAPLLVGAGWVLVSVVVVRRAHPGGLVRELRAGRSELAVAAAHREREAAERAVRTTIAQLSATLARESVQQTIHREAKAVEHEADALFRALVAVAVAPVRAGAGVVTRFR